MARLNHQNMRIKKGTLAFMLVVINFLVIIASFTSVEARDKGDDIIMTKGKLIVRGGKGKGNLILDTGKSNEHHEEIPMMPMMSHHFDPYSFYPMQHQQHHQPQVMIQPIILEDHSALGHHHQPEHIEGGHHHHEEPQQHYQHHEPQQHYQHHEPTEHHQEHHEPHHQEMHHYEQPNHYEQQHQHHEHMGHPQYVHEGHHEEEGHHGYESHPAMIQMMMHGSGLQPSYQQLAAMQAFQHPLVFAHHQIQNHPLGKESQAVNQQLQQNQQQQQEQQQSQASVQQKTQASVSQTNHKPISLIDQAANNPLVAIIKPLFKRNPNKQKKP